MIIYGIYTISLRFYETLMSLFLTGTFLIDFMFFYGQFCANFRIWSVLYVSLMTLMKMIYEIDENQNSFDTFIIDEKKKIESVCHKTSHKFCMTSTRIITSS